MILMEERLTMLVVEDNDIQRHAVAILACDMGLDIDIEEAPNGREALEKLKEKPFDILFTDIKMPFMDGLQLAEQAKQMYPYMQVIIFSAFNDFQFAKKAIEVGIYQYILKPLDIDNFSFLMKSVMGQCRKVNEEKQRLYDLEEISRLHRDIMRDKALLDMVYGRPVGREAQELLLEFHVFTSDYPKRLILADFDNDYVLADNIVQEYFRSIGILCIDLDANQCLLVAEDGADCGNESEKLPDKLMEQISRNFEGRTCLAISLPFGDISLLPGIFTRLERLIEKRFFYEGNIVLYESEPHDEKTAERPAGDTCITELIHTINGLLLEKKYELAGQRINSFFSSPQLADHSYYQIRYTGCRIMEHLSQYNNQLAPAGYINRINGMSSAVEINDFLLSSLLVIRDQDYESMNSQLIHQVIGLIKEHYHENIGLEWLAVQANISPGYLSTYFKLKMGVTLSHYLAQYRVNCSIQLLKETDFKVNDIAIKVGYPNYSYFCTLFKKYTGMTPAHCRSREEGAL
jgi:two-component system, response regulator YesN